MSVLVMLLALVMPPCASEDSQSCYWDAAHRGNGVGTSFVDLSGFTIYAEGN